MKADKARNLLWWTVRAGSHYHTPIKHRSAAMASFTVVAAPACSLASSAASLAGLKVSPPSARPSGFVSALPIRVLAARTDAQAAVEKEREILKRRALVLGAFASAIAVASNVHEANAAEAKKKKGKCTTICVQNPTASCCFGF